MPKTVKYTLESVLPWILLIGGAIGLYCSAVLVHDEIELLKNPAFQPSCNLNPVIACGSVMKSWEANVLGYLPNPAIGLITFPFLMAAGAAMLAGAKFKKWFWLLLNLGTLAGLVFVHWLFYQTVYQINALCPYCMGVWVVTITTFWYVTLYNLGQGYLKLPSGWQKVVTFVRRHHLDILILWFVIIAALILKHFWYYYGHYF
jgi:uncharacterized membrane protein